eukprot:CAMPEP_0181172102 /NCGR_PEP_ID=MMETSP1096-20121128/2273_1 /TAXON_ID=156174 ORGANISM="Chrysochromulina ericina, Strain CCMP281" /NCGR_SAMPLE_ID=MMETSP1096 /ASSEMBLY_ACC=CAM_ASM_000453 /LENGTH=67 /DNA_ID=CAMNT_0023259813 /DNA_START=107 /DNA_END=307 /DNA_ORIENTATION=-
MTECKGVSLGCAWPPLQCEKSIWAAPGSGMGSWSGFLRHHVEQGGGREVPGFGTHLITRTFADAGQD